MEDDDAFAEAIMLRHGIPEDVVFALRAVTRSYRAWGGSCEVSTPLTDGALLPFAGRAWRVLPPPGPLPLGHRLPRRGVRRAHRRRPPHQAHLLQPADLAPAGRRRSDRAPRALVAYLASLRATRDMELSVVLPGHGEPVEDHRALIDERFVMHERRADKLHGLVTERPRTAHELAQELWGNVAVTQAYLTLSEILGHVDLLLDDGRVVEEEADGVVHFVAAG